MRGSYPHERGTPASGLPNRGNISEPMTAPEGPRAREMPAASRHLLLSSPRETRGFLEIRHSW